MFIVYLFILISPIAAQFGPILSYPKNPCPPPSPTTTFAPVHLAYGCGYGHYQQPATTAKPGDIIFSKLLVIRKKPFFNHQMVPFNWSPLTNLKEPLIQSLKLPFNLAAKASAIGSIAPAAASAGGALVGSAVAAPIIVGSAIKPPLVAGGTAAVMSLPLLLQKFLPLKNKLLAPLLGGVNSIKSGVFQENNCCTTPKPTTTPSPKPPQCCIPQPQVPNVNFFGPLFGKLNQFKSGIQVQPNCCPTPKPPTTPKPAPQCCLPPVVIACCPQAPVPAPKPVTTPAPKDKIPEPKPIDMKYSGDSSMDSSLEAKEDIGN